MGTLLFDVKGRSLNILTTPVMLELEALLDRICTMDSLRFLVVRSGKPGGFMGGADVEEIRNIRTLEEAREKVDRGHAVFEKLQALPVPTLAVVDGICVGGGLELILACDFRFVTDSPVTRLMLPEVKIGIFPGLGGTQRLPRVVGLRAALRMILTGTSLSGKEAFRMGLADACLAADSLDAAIREFTASCPLSRVRRAKQRFERGRKVGLMEKVPFLRKLIFSRASADVMRRTKGRFPAPLAALEVVRKSFGKDLHRGLALEREAFSRIVISSTSKNLIRLFFATQELKKGSLPGAEPTTFSVGRVAVFGTGTMGASLSWLFSRCDIPILMKGHRPESIERGMAAVHSLYRNRVRRRRMSVSDMNEKLARIKTGTGFEGLSEVDFVLEAVSEDPDLKGRLLKEIEKRVPEKAIIATNTSSLSVRELSAHLQRPERFIGTHFFHPADRMLLVEIIPGPSTLPSVIAAVKALVRHMNRYPLVVRDGRGFLVNRILVAYLLEAERCLMDGVPFAAVDRKMEEFGMAVGPFRLLDEVGIPLALSVAGYIEEKKGRRLTTETAVLSVLTERRWFGRKAGRGFYIYGKKGIQENRALIPLLPSLDQGGRVPSDDQIRDRLVLAMANEAAACLADGVVEKPSHLDAAVIFGAGFPAFRGGIIRYAHDQGFDHIRSRLTSLAEVYGSRFNPSPYWENPVSGPDV
ncbi:MAG: enoyl-CoA hydratase/isomerase family protein [Acidobacteria bacterium]|nr:enoyl-CoA hydratase/isomerase family protein [Acidobacteriota bacterium]